MHKSLSITTGIFNSVGLYIYRKCTETISGFLANSLIGSVDIRGKENKRKEKNIKGKQRLRRTYDGYVTARTRFRESFIELYAIDYPP